ncbi:Dihydroxyacetone synthase [Serendipita sp. 400]|nr:Dihydroxyacetone synthase [Serendipita sp. 400]
MYIFTTLVTTIPFLFTFATARPQARALLPSVDTCANIDVNILTLLNIPDATNSGHLQACLCASTVGPFVQANAQASLASSLVGEDTVVNALLNVILGMGSQCMYPVHAVSLCLAEAPCDFGCTDGYTRVDSTCVCQAPKIECNGVCQTQACSSAVPQRRNLDTQSRMRALTEERCPPGSQLCGRGSSWKRGDDDWECIDINTSLDSCRSAWI